MSAAFDTGDNPATGKHILLQAFNDLFRLFPGSFVVKQWADTVGPYAKLVRIPKESSGFQDNISFILVGRGTYFFKQAFSIHKFIVDYAAAGNYWLVVAYKPTKESEILYYFCDPLEARKMQITSNERLDSKYLNLPVSILRRWKLIESIKSSNPEEREVQKLRTPLER